MVTTFSALILAVPLVGAYVGLLAWIGLKVYRDLRAERRDDRSADTR